jgi:hypothetical protein
MQDSIQAYCQEGSFLTHTGFHSGLLTEEHPAYCQEGSFFILVGFHSSLLTEGTPGLLPEKTSHNHRRLFKQKRLT